MALPSSFTVPNARAVNQGGNPTKWTPYGAFADRKIITVYADFEVLFGAFENGEVDLTDWPVDPNKFASYGGNPDMFLTDGIAEFGIFELDINHHNQLFGVSQQEASGLAAPASPLKPTAAGTEVRRAIAHLLDKPDYENCSQCVFTPEHVDIQSPPAQGLLGNGVAVDSKLDASVRAEDCAAHSWFTPCDATTPPVSAYNLTPDAIGGAAFIGNTQNNVADHGYSGTNDLRASCDHFVAAGATISGGGSCVDVAAGTQKLSLGGDVGLYIRTHLARRGFGQILADSINWLFGPAGCSNAGNGCATKIRYGDPSTGSRNPVYFVISQVSDIVFRTAPARDDWQLYTGGWSLGSNPDHLYALYHSDFASDVCGGKKSVFAQNYMFYCSPDYDTQSENGQFAANLAAASSAFASAAVIAHRNVMTIPVYSGAGNRFVALQAWDGLVSQNGAGFQAGFWSEFNMRAKVPCTVVNEAGCYSPADSQFAAGGGDPSTIRRGFSQEVHKLSLFQATTVWDFEVLVELYDSMLASNPLTAGVGAQIMDWMTVSHTSTYDSVNDRTTQTWKLRKDLTFHNGQPVTADDVVYTILAYRDVPSANLQPSVANVISAVAASSRDVVVTLARRSPFYELNIGGLPIIPKSVWVPFCGAVPNDNSQCADPAFDPMQAGIMIGSGPWECRHIQTGVIGGTCTQTAGGQPGTQDVSLGGRVLLTKNEGYMRNPNLQGSSFQALSWADGDDSGKVDILDIAAAALNFGGASQYWDHTLFGVTDEQVDIGEIATIAFYFDHGITSPIAPGTMTGMAPLDPFGYDPAAGVGLYYEGTVKVGGNLLVEIHVLQGNAAALAGQLQVKLVPEGGVWGGTAFAGALEGANDIIFTIPAPAPGHYWLYLDYNNALARRANNDPLPGLPLEIIVS